MLQLVKISDWGRFFFRKRTVPNQKCPKKNRSQWDIFESTYLLLLEKNGKNNLKVLNYQIKGAIIEKSYDSIQQSVFLD